MKELHEELAETLKAVQENAKKAQEQQKAHFDKNRKDVGRRMDVGRLVLMKKRTLDYAGTSAKLQRPWAGPYRVVEKTSDVNRVIQHVNNPEQRITVHVSQLKPFIGREEDIELPEGEWEVQDILEEREVRPGEVEYLVRWAGHTKKHNSWVAEEDMHADEILARWKQRPIEQRRPATHTKQNTPGRRGKGKERQPHRTVSEFEPQTRTSRSGRLIRPPPHLSQALGARTRQRSKGGSVIDSV
jgi:hypothetical protein